MPSHSDFSSMKGMASCRELVPKHKSPERWHVVSQFSLSSPQNQPVVGGALGGALGGASGGGLGGGLGGADGGADGGRKGQ